MKILFVCTGNTCRSPMAEGIFRKIAQDCKQETLFCTSAGIAAVDGEPATRNAVQACAEIGVDISSHRARSLRSVNDWSTFDFFVCMTAAHASTLCRAGVPQNKLCVLGDEIPDPYGGNLDVYRACRDAIEKALEGLCQTLKARRAKEP